MKIRSVSKVLRREHTQKRDKGDITLISNSITAVKSSGKWAQGPFHYMDAILPVLGFPYKNY